MKLPTNDWVVGSLKSNLEALAADFERQHALDPTGQDAVDEITSVYFHWLEVTLQNHQDELTTEQIEKLTAVESFIQAIPASLLNDEALRTAREWHQLRLLARDALNEMGWSPEGAI